MIKYSNFKHFIFIFIMFISPMKAHWQTENEIDSICEEINLLSQKLQKDIFPEWYAYYNATFKCKDDTLFIYKTTYYFDKNKNESESKFDTTQHSRSIYKLAFNKIELSKGYKNWHSLFFNNFSDSDGINLAIQDIYDFEISPFISVPVVDVQYNVAERIGKPVWSPEELKDVVTLGDNISKLIAYYSEKK